MKDYNDDINLIEKFLGGKMTDEEKKAFAEKRLKDQELNLMLHDMDLLVEGIKLSATKTSKEEKQQRLKFFDEIMKMEERASEEEKSAPRHAKIVPIYRKASVLAIAASVVLVMTVGIYSVQNRAPLNERLYTAYFEPFDAPGIGLTRGNSEVSLKSKAYQAYDNGNFELATSLFEKVVAEDIDIASVDLCLGNAYLIQGKTDKAEERFTHVLTKHNELITQAKWYLALTYLKQSRLEKAKATLWENSKSSTYGEKAQKLLKELD